jgi:hypothetical protein
MADVFSVLTAGARFDRRKFSSDITVFATQPSAPQARSTGAPPDRHSAGVVRARAKQPPAML